MADSIPQTNFEKLLGLFDAADREAAGARYEALRTRLIGFFEWRGANAPEELADTVFDRLLRKLGEGERIEKVGAYAAAVAQFVYRERARDPRFFDVSLDDAPEAANARATADPASDAAAERRLACLDRCLAALDADTRRLLVAYHDTDERTMIAARRRLAENLQISLNTLRIRVCRHKRGLEKCVRECCAANDG